MKIWKILLMVLAVSVGAPAVSMAADGNHKAGRTVASAKAKKKGKKGKGAKHAKAGKGKKRAGKVAKGKKAKKGHKAAKGKKLAGAGHQSHAPSAPASVSEPVPSMEIPHEAKDDLPPPNNGNLPE